MVEFGECDVKFGGRGMLGLGGVCRFGGVMVGLGG